jgi:hypothetical protein
MDADLMPFSLIAKLLGGLALCFGVLVGLAWLLRKQWPSLLGAAKGARREDKGIQVLQTRGLGPGAALHLLEVDGARLLVLQGKERSEVIWTRDDGKDLGEAFESSAEGGSMVEGPGAAPRTMPQGAAARPAADAWSHADGPAGPMYDEALRLRHDRALAQQRDRQRRYRERRRQLEQASGLFQFPSQAAPRP